MAAIAFIGSGQITIRGNLLFYGTYAEPILAQKIIDEINTMWNAPQAQWLNGEQSYLLNFDISYEILAPGKVAERFFTDNTYLNNFIRLEEKNVSERSMMGFGLGENSGHWIITDQLGESTTAAHEFGHAMGLPHPVYNDYRGLGFPPIMAPRGSFVDKEFQWNPTVEPGEYGGTMRPIHRRVQASEVVEVLKNLNPQKGPEHRIGKISQNLFSLDGQPMSVSIS